MEPTPEQLKAIAEFAQVLVTFYTVLSITGVGLLIVLIYLIVKTWKNVKE